MTLYQGYLINDGFYSCTIRSACQKASHSSPRWLSLGTGQQCIDFEQILPDRIPITQMTTVGMVSI